jgi:putative transposase
MPKIDKIFFWQNSHTFHRYCIHFVFVPKYRRRVLQGEVALRIRQLFFECCEVNDWFIHEIEVMPDHLHVLIQLRPDVAPAKAAMFLKGGSSRKLRKEFPELEEFLWGDSFWQDGYFMETIGRMDEKVMREYIQNQKTERPKTSHGL